MISNACVYRYTWALDNQPTHPALESPLVQLAAVVLFAVGSTLVLTSMYALGVTGTYLGKQSMIVIGSKMIDILSFR